MVGNWNMGLVFDESGTDGVECDRIEEEVRLKFM